MTTQWKRRPEGGGYFAIWLIRTIARRGGRLVARALLWPITLYFLVMRGLDRAHDLVEQYHPGHERTPREMAGQAGMVVGQGEGHRDTTDCRKGIMRCRRAAPGRVRNQTVEPPLSAARRGP